MTSPRRATSTAMAAAINQPAAGTLSSPGSPRGRMPAARLPRAPARSSPAWCPSRSGSSARPAACAARTARRAPRGPPRTHRHRSGTGAGRAIFGTVYSERRFRVPVRGGCAACVRQARRATTGCLPRPMRRERGEHRPGGRNLRGDENSLRDRDRDGAPEGLACFRPGHRCSELGGAADRRLVQLALRGRSLRSGVIEADSPVRAPGSSSGTTTRICASANGCSPPVPGASQ